MKMTPPEIAGYIADHGQWTYSRSSGPGGQRRDHAETEVRLMVTPDALIGLPPRIAARLADRLHLTERRLRLRAGTERLREHNRAIVQLRLLRLVQGALAPAPPPRRATRPSKGSVERRLSTKRHRATVKAQRAAPDD
jgi:ribosome-associated protein